MTRAIIIFVASGAYSGFVPAAPGTAGSIVGLALARAALPWARAHWLAASAVFAVLFAGGCWVAQRAQQIFGQHDSPRIVLDEVMGMIATMFLNPLDWIHLLIGFVLFRLFDIVKVPPASFFDRNLRGGSGVMLDDLAAAVYANIALRLVAHLIV
ncbi:MAG TPA: phosphatidylglycerophosphatase A [Candidatus Binataceae bacterium]|jgi:phosphatidylglycerophosphatase A|nr:phosphatidylglycerophosphatase A [Candidatus Binataceae bacterium]